MASVPASWRLIENVLRENAHSVFQALRKPATDVQLRWLEGRLSAKLPRDFVQSLKVHDGLRNSYLDQVRLFNYWALLPIRAIWTEWKGMTDLQAEGDFGGCQCKVTPRLKNDSHWRAGWVPFMDADGDKLVLDLDPGARSKVGQVFKWSNSGSFAPRVLADSFGVWLAAVAAALSRRQFRLDKYGGIWLESEELA
jgi:cell wall assembly regulator SMI1